MNINITYDSSATNAPAAFKTAVQAAVNYLDALITSNITVNIQFGWGVLNGAPMDANAIGESKANYSVLTYAQVKAALIGAATSTDDKTSTATLPAIDPSGGAEFWVATAEQKALGIFSGDTSTLDGYVSLGSGLNFNFDPNYLTNSQYWDAIGALEHEITEVLGRVGYVGAIAPDKAHVDTVLDLFRYTGPGARQLTLTAQDAYFSVDGKAMLTPFNGPSWSGDLGDWGYYESFDAFRAFITQGFPISMSATDMRVLDVLGYKLKNSLTVPSTPAAQGSAPSSSIISSTLDIAQGANVTLAADQPLVVQYNKTTDPAPMVNNAGTIYTKNAAGSGLDLIAFRDGTAATNFQGQLDKSVYNRAWFNNLADGKIYVLDQSNGGVVAAAYEPNTLSGAATSLNIHNVGLIQVVSLNGSAYGFKEFGTDEQFQVENDGVLKVWSTKNSTGIEMGRAMDLINAGTIEVSGANAVGVVIDPYMGTSYVGYFRNSGSIIATTDTGLNKSIGVNGSVANSGAITADIAVENGTLLNTGAIHGDLVNVNTTNRGTISGTVDLTQGGSYDGRHGALAGSVLVTGTGGSVWGGAIPLTVSINADSTSVALTKTGPGSWNLGSTGLQGVRYVHFNDKTVTLAGSHPYPDTHDYVGDNTSQYLIENTSGSVYLGAAPHFGAQSLTNIASLGPEWSFKGYGDFLQSGRDAFLIENSAGAIYVGSIQANAVNYTYLASVGPEWKIWGCADFLGDGRASIIMENSAGVVAIGEAAPGGQPAWSAVASLGPEWSCVGLGDFLGKGHAQFLIENSNGLVAVGDASASGATYAAIASLGPEWKFVGVGDFTKAGHTEFLIENSAGAVVVGNWTGSGVIYTQIASLGPEWSFVGVGDYSGTGSDQFMIENTNGAVYVSNYDPLSNILHGFYNVTSLGPEWHFH